MSTHAIVCSPHSIDYPENSSDTVALGWSYRMRDSFLLQIDVCEISDDDLDT